MTNYGYVVIDNSRVQKAKKIIACLEFVNGEVLKNKRILEIGCGSGLISHEISKHGNQIISIDVEDMSVKECIKKFEPLLLNYINFQSADGSKLPFKSNVFDIVVCNQVIEHFHKQRQQQLIDESYRVLKQKGMFYIATPNKIWPIEPHTKLPFLQFLSRNVADRYIKLFKKIETYDVALPTFWRLNRILHDFDRVIDLTPVIIKESEKFFIKDEIPNPLRSLSKRIPLSILRLFSPFFPSLVIIGVKQ